MDGIAIRRIMHMSGADGIRCIAILKMSESHIVIWVDRADYDHLQRAYARLHITPSQVLRIAVDRFLTDLNYRQQHPFAVAQPIERDPPGGEGELVGLDPDDEEDEPAKTRKPGHAENGSKVSFRIDRGRRDALRAILREPYSLGAFVRGALVCPGVVLGSRYLDDRFRDLVGDAEALLSYWDNEPGETVYDVSLIDAQVDMSKRRGAVLRRK